MTQREAAAALPWSTSKLIRVEHGEIRVSANDVRDLLDVYDVDGEQRDELLAMAQRTSEDSWAEYSSLYPRQYLNYLDLEASSHSIQSWCPTLIPGLLQTEDYTKAILTKPYDISKRIVGRHWRVRVRRQELHYRVDCPTMHFILDEAVVRRMIGGKEVMKSQLQRVQDFQDVPSITVQILPFEAGENDGMLGTFTALGFGLEDEPLVVVDDSNDFKYIKDPLDTANYMERFQDIESQALSADASSDLLNDAIASITEELRRHKA